MDSTVCFSHVAWGEEDASSCVFTHAIRVHAHTQGTGGGGYKFCFVWVGEVRECVCVKEWGREMVCVRERVCETERERDCACERKGD